MITWKEKTMTPTILGRQVLDDLVKQGLYSTLPTGLWFSLNELLRQPATVSHIRNFSSASAGSSPLERFMAATKEFRDFCDHFFLKFFTDNSVMFNYRTMKPGGLVLSYGVAKFDVDFKTFFLGSPDTNVYITDMTEYLKMFPISTQGITKFEWAELLKYSYWELDTNLSTKSMTLRNFYEDFVKKFKAINDSKEPELEGSLLKNYFKGLSAGSFKKALNIGNHAAQLKFLQESSLSEISYFCTALKVFLNTMFSNSAEIFGPMSFSSSSIVLQNYSEQDFVSDVDQELLLSHKSPLKTKSSILALRMLAFLKDNPQIEEEKLGSLNWEALDPTVQSSEYSKTMTDLINVLVHERESSSKMKVPSVTAMKRALSTGLKSYTNLDSASSQEYWSIIGGIIPIDAKKLSYTLKEIIQDERTIFYLPLEVNELVQLFNREKVKADALFSVLDSL